MKFLIRRQSPLGLAQNLPEVVLRRHRWGLVLFVNQQFVVAVAGAVDVAGGAHEYETEDEPPSSPRGERAPVNGDQKMLDGDEFP